MLLVNYEAISFMSVSCTIIFSDSWKQNFRHLWSALSSFLWSKKPTCSKMKGAVINWKFDYFELLYAVFLHHYNAESIDSFILKTFTMWPMWCNAALLLHYELYWADFNLLDPSPPVRFGFQQTFFLMPTSLLWDFVKFLCNILFLHTILIQLENLDKAFSRFGMQELN